MHIVYIRKVSRKINNRWKEAWPTVMHSRHPWKHREVHIGWTFQHHKPHTTYVHYSLCKTDLPLLLALRLIYLHIYLHTVELDDEKSDENTIHVVGNSSRGEFWQYLAKLFRVGACHRGVGEWDVTTETAKQETTESVRFFCCCGFCFSEQGRVPAKTASDTSPPQPLTTTTRWRCTADQEESMALRSHSETSFALCENWSDPRPPTPDPPSHPPPPAKPLRLLEQNSTQSNSFSS